MKTIELLSLDGEKISSDLYTPDQTTHGRAAILFLHGGGFIGGDKEQFRAIAMRLSEKDGTVCLSINYRLGFPQSMLDALGGVSWLYAQRERLKLDPDRIWMCGGSPGANIGALAMVTAADWLPNKIGNEWMPRKGIWLNGIMDLQSFLMDNPEEEISLSAYFHAPVTAERLCGAAPIAYDTSRMEWHFLHGECDAVVPLKRIRQAMDTVQSAGGKATLHVFSNCPHAWFNAPSQTQPVCDVISGLTK